MIELEEGQQWQTPSIAPCPSDHLHEACVATIRRVESGWVHYRYRDETTAGMFAGNDSDPVDAFRSRFPIRHRADP